MINLCILKLNLKYVNKLYHIANYLSYNEFYQVYQRALSFFVLFIQPKMFTLSCSMFLLIFQ